MSNLTQYPKLTPQSRIYRRKAAAFSRLAEAESDPEKIFPLIQQALSWIQFAENEEVLNADDDHPELVVSSEADLTH